MKRHESMRGYFAYELYQKMLKDTNIWLLVGDLGYKIFDDHFRDFPDRCINTGAAEIAMMGIAVGLALQGKIPVVYSITTFLLYRPFETIRLYLNHERIAVKLVGSGRDKNYERDGISHWSEDAVKLFPTSDVVWDREMAIFPNITAYWPENKEQIPTLLDQYLYTTIPSFLSLTR